MARSYFLLSPLTIILWLISTLAAVWATEVGAQLITDASRTLAEERANTTDEHTSISPSPNLTEKLSANEHEIKSRLSNLSNGAASYPRAQSGRIAPNEERPSTRIATENAYDEVDEANATIMPTTPVPLATAVPAPAVKSHPLPGPKQIYLQFIIPPIAIPSDAKGQYIDEAADTPANSNSTEPRPQGPAQDERTLSLKRAFWEILIGELNNRKILIKTKPDENNITINITENFGLTKDPNISTEGSLSNQWLVTTESTREGFKNDTQSGFEDERRWTTTKAYGPPNEFSRSPTPLFKIDQSFAPPANYTYPDQMEFSAETDLKTSTPQNSQESGPENENLDDLEDIVSPEMPAMPPEDRGPRTTEPTEVTGTMGSSKTSDGERENTSIDAAVTEQTTGQPLIKISGIIRILRGMDWMWELEDRSSPEFQYYSGLLQTTLESVFKATPLSNILAAIYVENFWRGSVFVRFHMVLSRSSTTLLQPDYVLRLFESRLSRNYLGPFLLDPEFSRFEIASSKLDEEGARDPPIPQWAIAVIVIAAASFIFIVLFGTVTVSQVYTRPRDSDEDPVLPSKEWESKMGYDNFGATDSNLYDLDDMLKEEEEYQKRFEKSFDGHF